MGIQIKTAMIFVAAAALVANGAAADFEFVVIGDTRPRFESEDFRVFEGLIQKINQTKPALVINLGDLIYGYGMRKERQWAKYEAAVKQFEVPYYQLPGNHDTFSKQARRMYGRRFGKFYESFNYGDCHFVLLDACEETRWGYLGPQQLKWLKADLSTNSLRPVFVFLHFPLWEPERIKPEYHEFWRATLHPLFRESGVKAVFGGHCHCYGPTVEMDGIRYFITGGGGAELRPDYRKSGGEHHFVRVKVSGDRFDLRVVTGRGEMTDPEADVMGGFRFAEKHSSRIGIVRGTRNLREGIACSVVVENPYKDWLTGKASWRLDSSVFTAEPESAEVRVPPGGAANPSFTIKALKDTVNIQSLPWIEFNLVSGGTHHRFHREMLFVEQLETPYANAPLAVDGSLPEWTSAPRLQLGRRASELAEVRAFHDRQALYLAVTLPAKPKPAAEEQQEEEAFADDLVVGIAGRISETEFSGDVLRMGFTRTGRVTEVRDRTPGHKADRFLRDVKAASRMEESRTTFEVAIPIRLITPLPSAGKNRLMLSLSYPSADGDAVVEPADPTRNSFAYQVRYGGDTLVPVQFVELLLDRRSQRN